MPVTVPPSLLIVLQVLRPCFTAPSFVTLAALVTGALSGAGRRTVTGMWQAAGLAGRVHWSRAHRFFARAVWDLDQVGLALARAVVARLVPDGGAVTVAVDDTLFHRYGKKVHGAKYQHDGSARGRDGIGRGNCFVIVGVVAAVPFLARQVCLPALFRLHIPKTGASKTEQARAMVDLLARPCPGAPSTWWRRPASADRPGAACPPASLHHPPGRQRGPAPTRTRRTGRDQPAGPWQPRPNHRRAGSRPGAAHSPGGGGCAMTNPPHAHLLAPPGPQSLPHQRWAGVSDVRLGRYGIPAVPARISGSRPARRRGRAPGSPQRSPWVPGAAGAHAAARRRACPSRPGSPGGGASRPGWRGGRHLGPDHQQGHRQLVPRTLQPFCRIGPAGGFAALGRVRRSHGPDGRRA